jgi:hypothetical protein
MAPVGNAAASRGARNRDVQILSTLRPFLWKEAYALHSSICAHATQPQRAPSLPSQGGPASPRNERTVLRRHPRSNLSWDDEELLRELARGPILQIRPRDVGEAPLLPRAPGERCGQSRRSSHRWLSIRKVGAFAPHAARLQKRLENKRLTRRRGDLLAIASFAPRHYRRSGIIRAAGTRTHAGRTHPYEMIGLVANGRGDRLHTTRVAGCWISCSMIRLFRSGADGILYEDLTRAGAPRHSPRLLQRRQQRLRDHNWS